jgi:hypothetical protein
VTIQKLFLDVLKYSNIAKIDVLKVTPEGDKLRMQSYDGDRVLFIDAYTHDSYPEITGEFGLFNFKILKGLLSLPNFQSENATFKIGTRKIDDGQFPDRIDFRGGGTKATFRLMNKEVVPEQPTIVNIPWDITLTPTPSKVAEFQQMASLYSDVEGMFSIRTDGTDLVVDFGNDSASTHSASMVLATEVNGALVGDMKFPIAHFLTLMKLTADTKSTELRLTSKGLLGVVSATDYATYNYYVKKSL